MQTRDDESSESQEGAIEIKVAKTTLESPGAAFNEQLLHLSRVLRYTTVCLYARTSMRL